MPEKKARTKKATTKKKSVKTSTAPKRKYTRRKKVEEPQLQMDTAADEQTALDPEPTQPIAEQLTPLEPAPVQVAQPVVQPMSEPPEPENGDDDRDAARQARLERKKREMEERARRREMANRAAEIGNITPIASAVKPKAEVKPPSPPTGQPKIAAAPPIQPSPVAVNKPATVQPLIPKQAVQGQNDGENPVIQLTLPDLQAYKVQASELAMANIANPIRTKAKEEAQRRLNMEIAQALRANERYQAAQADMEIAVNEVLDLMQSQLPEGYAITNILAKDKVVICRYAPEQVGKRFKIGK